MDSLPSQRRMIVVVVIAAAILLGLVIATGGSTLPGSSSGPVSNPPTSAPVSPTAAPQGVVRGTVALTVHHLKGHTWRFSYRVHNTGKTPIGGFQINSPTAYLFHVKGPGWNYFGSGVCGEAGQHQGILIYWSTNSAASDLITPGHSTTFGFDVNTSGSISSGYALSWGTATPYFGQTKGPAGSTLKATGSCK